MNTTKTLRALFAALFLCVAVSAPVFAEESGTKKAPPAASVGHGISFFDGELKYGPDFTHFGYANPDAPKGGVVAVWALGTFDSVNPFILQGRAVALVELYTFATLMARAYDERYSRYGYIAETAEVPRDRSWIAFTLRPEARFHDGTPITAEDVVFTLNTFKDPAQADPEIVLRYQDILSAEKTGPRTVKFLFRKGGNRELPLRAGGMPVLSAAYWKGRDFAKATREPVLGSGPYKIGSMNEGSAITYERVNGWWGENLPVNRGRYNFGAIRVKYYRDSGIALEAFKAGEYDYRYENSSTRWATAYHGPAIDAGMIQAIRDKTVFPDNFPQGMQGFIYNTRRHMFKDPRTREALTYAFDFEWENCSLMQCAYTRARSYFNQSELAATGLPAGKELAILEKFRGKIPNEVFTKEYNPPKTDGSGNNRDNLREARRLLREAGWVLNKTTNLLEHPDLKDAEGTPTPFRFEVLLDDDGFERLTEPFQQNLKKLGVELSMRRIDATAYEKRLDDFDYDVIVANVWSVTQTPEDSFSNYWGSTAAESHGSKNYSGIKDPVIDELIALVLAAESGDELLARTHALDRMLEWGHYVMPNWYLDWYRTARWNIFGLPPVEPKYSMSFYEDTWWVDAEKAQCVARWKENKPLSPQCKKILGLQTE